MRVPKSTLSMDSPAPASPPLPTEHKHSPGFARADLLFLILAAAMVVLLIIPGRSHAGAQDLALACMNNHRSLAQAWASFASDNGGVLVNNYDITETMASVAGKTYTNWTHNVVDWSAASMNTNRDLIRSSKLFPYLAGNELAFKCPSDNYLSTVQRSLGWARRARSYSMNGFMGRSSSSPSDTGVSQGLNPYYPQYRQFIRESSVPHPADTFVFVDEHPDSINDGLFLNSPGTSSTWGDMPASLHNGAGGFAFADGHAEIHAWTEARTKVAVRFLYSSVSAAGSADYAWLASRTSVNPTMLAFRPVVGNGNGNTNKLLVAWSALPTNYVLQASGSATAGSWTNSGIVPLKQSGQNSAEVPLSSEQQFFRLRRP